MDHKSIVVSVDIGGWIGLELNSDISHRCVELEVWPSAAVLAEDVGCQVVTIIEGQKVILPQMETKANSDNMNTSVPSALCIVNV